MTPIATRYATSHDAWYIKSATLGYALVRYADGPRFTHYHWQANTAIRAGDYRMALYWELRITFHVEYALFPPIFEPLYGKGIMAIIEEATAADVGWDGVDAS